MTKKILELSEKDIVATLKGIDIPSSPQLVVDLQFEMASPNIDIDKVVELISKDAGMSGKVIKLINSPVFGMRGRITSIKHAISLLGVQNIVNIVHSLAVPESFSRHKLIDMTDFWDNAADVAITATTIARITGITVPDEAYTLGLFHNVGIALLIEKFPYYSDLLKLAYSEKNRRITETENDKISCNHAVAGYYVAKSWKLPLHICEAIADHHKTEAIFSDELRCDIDKKNLLAILKLAETICKTYQTFGNESIDYEFVRIKEDLFSYLGISEYEFEILEAEVLDTVMGH